MDCVVLNLGINGNAIDTSVVYLQGVGIMRDRRMASATPHANATEHKYPRREYVPPKSQDVMLTNILAETDVNKKRELIKEHNQFHYIFGTALKRLTQEDLLTDVNEGDNHD